MLKVRKSRLEKILDRLTKLFDILAVYHPDINFDVLFNKRSPRVGYHVEQNHEIGELIRIDESVSYFLTDDCRHIEITTNSYLGSEIPAQALDLEDILVEAGFEVFQRQIKIRFYRCCEQDFKDLLEAILNLIWDELLKPYGDGVFLSKPDFDVIADEFMDGLELKAKASTGGKKKKDERASALLNLGKNGLQLKLNITYPEHCVNSGYIEVSVAHSYDPKYQDLVDRINKMAQDCGFYLE